MKILFVLIKFWGRFSHRTKAKGFFATKKAPNIFNNQSFGLMDFQVALILGSGSDFGRVELPEILFTWSSACSGSFEFFYGSLEVSAESSTFKVRTEWNHSLSWSIYRTIIFKLCFFLPRAMIKAFWSMVNWWILSSIRQSASLSMMPWWTLCASWRISFFKSWT